MGVCATVFSYICHYLPKLCANNSPEIIETKQASVYINRVLIMSPPYSLYSVTYI